MGIFAPLIVVGNHWVVRTRGAMTALMSMTDVGGQSLIPLTAFLSQICRVVKGALAPCPPFSLEDAWWARLPFAHA
jgi:hypothetical protein